MAIIFNPGMGPTAGTDTIMGDTADDTINGLGEQIISLVAVLAVFPAVFPGMTLYLVKPF